MGKCMHKDAVDLIDYDFKVNVRSRCPVCTLVAVRTAMLWESGRYNYSHSNMSQLETQIALDYGEVISSEQYPVGYAKLMV